MNKIIIMKYTNKIYLRNITIFLAIQIFIQAVIPIQLLALTSGPNQPEFSKFEVVQSSDMVDLFTGDFKYNIPLLNIPGKNGGYPINLFYNSVTNVEEEASMVGLGWNLGIGQINRTMRGLPDDFSGERIKRDVYVKPQIDIAANIGANFEAFGIDKIGNLSLELTAGIQFNSYEGLGFMLGTGLNFAPSGKDIAGNFALSSSTISGDSYNASLSSSLTKLTKDLHRAGIGISGNGIDLNMSLSSPLNGNNLQINSFVNPTFIPNHDLSFGGKTTGFSFKAGPEGWWLFPNGKVSGFASEKRLKTYSFSLPGYGNIHSDEAYKSIHSLMDFRRINDNAVHKNTTNLAAPINMYDIFSISSHFGSSSFSFYRDDFGLFRDASSKSESFGYNLGGETGAGNAFKVGVDLSIPYEIETNEPHLVSTGGLQFKNNLVNDRFEKGHFRCEDEMSGQIYLNQSGLEVNENAKNISVNEKYLGNNDLCDFQIVGGGVGSHPKVQNKIINKKSGEEVLVENLKRKERFSRSKALIEYQRKDLFVGGNNSLNNIKVPYLRIKTFTSGIQNPENIGHDNYILESNYTAVSGNQTICAFEEIQENGKRCIYGLPVKNFKTRNVLFSYNRNGIENQSKCLNTVDIPKDGEKIKHKTGVYGSNEILDATEIPEYAHAYMLTSVLGEDYIDTNPNDGEPNDSDFGHWIKFSYIKTNSENNPFRWRVPFLGASYNAGKLSLDSDDTASYSYGEREQYYPYLIETDSHIAKFFYKRRSDNRGAVSELQNEINDWSLASYSYKLDKIELYAKGNTGNMVLEKTVCFQYKPIGLCKGITNSFAPSEGKLTLEKVFINQYNSTRGSQNPYIFTYNDNSDPKYDYNAENFDRWGVFRLKSENICYPHQFSYTDLGIESEEEINSNAGAYHLKSVKLPSGAVINVDVSRDHYAYVQDKPVTQFYKILGVGTRTGNKIDPKNNNNQSLNIFFQGPPNMNANDFIKDLYTDNLGAQMFFKIQISLLNDSGGSDTKELVLGAAYVEQVNVVNASEGIYNVLLKQYDNDLVDLRDGIIRHPFSISAWQYLKTHARRLLMPTSTVEFDPNANAIEREIEKFKAFSPKLDIFKKFFNNCADKGYGNTLDLNHSFIRLNNPLEKKYGGGVKVDRVVVSDIWQYENINDDIKYGTTYEYTDKKMINNVIHEKSNGVASNEPEIGKEENACYYMRSIKQNLLFTGHNYSFEVHPVNDMFFPGPVVGYSKVKVRSLPSFEKYYNEDYQFSEASTTGESVHEFYTAKEFPVITENSNLVSKRFKPDFKLLFQKTVYTASQGYFSESNDMHGKVKKISYFGQKRDGGIIETPVSSIHYEYLTVNENYKWGIKNMKRMRLVNDNIDLQMQPELINGNTTNKVKVYKGSLGKKIQMYGDVRNTYGGAFSLGAGINFDLSIIPIPFIPFFLPLLVVTVIPNLNINEQYYQSAVTNKHIHKKGILKKVTVTDGESVVVTENKTFDPFTGNVLASSVTNHHNNPVYNINIPAYHGYQRMGPAMFNIATKLSYTGLIKKDKCTNFYALQPAPEEMIKLKKILTPGDECVLELRNNSLPGNNSIIRSTAVFEKPNRLCDDNGNLESTLLFHINDELDIDEEYQYQIAIRIIRSGNRNMLNAQGQSVTCLEYSKPQGSPYPGISDILNAEANTYSDFWRYFDAVDRTKACDQVHEGADNNISQYNTGSKGVFLLDGQFMYSAKRHNPDENRKGIINQDPQFPFRFFNWSDDSGHKNNIVVPYVADPSRYWLLKDRVTNRNNSLDITETKNALDIYNSVLYTNITKKSDIIKSPNKVHATVKNSRNYESLFTSFESYEFDKGRERHNHFDLNLPHDNNLIVREEKFPVQNQNEHEFILFEKFEDWHEDQLIGAHAEVYYSDIKGGSPASLSFIIENVKNVNSYLKISSNEEKYNCDNVPLNKKPDFIIIRTVKNEVVSIGNISPSQFAHTGKGSLQIFEPTWKYIPKTLRLIPGKKYYFSCWAAKNTNDIYDISEDNVKVFIKDGDVNIEEMRIKPGRINGWQLVNGEFTAPSNGKISVDFNTGSSTALLIDDMRIHPYEAMMESYVYDDKTFQLKYILDDNNYYTKYIYDGQGKLTGIQKETERGVKTVKESHSYLAPSDVSMGMKNYNFPFTENLKMTE
jgi:hypothetical protein